MSESLPTTFGGLGHHINEHEGFELLQSSDLLQTFKTGHMPPIDYLVFQESVRVQSPS